MAVRRPTGRARVRIPIGRAQVPPEDRPVAAPPPTSVLRRPAALVGWVAVLALQGITAVFAFRLDRETLRPLWALPLQQFVYRQLMYAVLLSSVTTALAGRRLRWQKLERSGQVTVEV